MDIGKQIVSESSLGPSYNSQSNVISQSPDVGRTAKHCVMFVACPSMLEAARRPNIGFCFKMLHSHRR